MVQKKFLHCTMLAVLSLFFTSSASAVSITNMDEVPHNLTLNVGGKITTVSLMPWKRWESNVYPVKVVYDNYTSPALKPNSDYAIWDDGKVILQRSRPNSGGEL